MRQFSALFAGFASCVWAHAAVAADVDVHASAAFRQAPTMSVEQDMNFTPDGQAIEYQAQPTSADRVQLGTDGSLSATGSAFLPPTTGQAGAVRVSGDDTSAVDISCTNDAALTTSTGAALTLTNLEFAVDQGTSAGNAVACQGLGTVSSTHTLDGDDQLLVGGELVGDSSLTDGTYSTANAGGTPATFRVIYN